jgi:hypothetical protein
MVCEAAVFNTASAMANGRKVVEVVEEGELPRSEERKRKDHELRKFEMFLKSVPEGVVGGRSEDFLEEGISILCCRRPPLVSRAGWPSSSCCL